MNLQDIPMMTSSKVFRRKMREQIMQHYLAKKEALQRVKVLKLKTHIFMRIILPFIVM